MTSALHHKIRRTIRKYQLIPPGSRVLIGLSGGSDSIALTLVLQALAEHDGFLVAGLAHLNHRLRDEADADEHFCRSFAERRQLPLTVESSDVGEYARTNRLSVEDAARTIRYDFLERVAKAAGASPIAVGHTQDDQAETLLLKLMRGAGPAALGGIYPRRGAIVRPFLEVARAELRAYLGHRGEEWVEDATNADLTNPRNRIRHRVLPELALALRGDPKPAIARAAALLREDGQWLNDVARQRFDTLVTGNEQGLEAEAAALREMPPPVRRRVLLEGLKRTAGAREVTQEHVEAALCVLLGGGGADIPGGRVELRREMLVLVQHGHIPK